MLLYHTNSWHYLLVLYVLGKNFFTEKDTIDFDASHKTQTIIWTRKPRVVNFCPYCRAVLYSSMVLPFIWIWRLYPHKPKKEKSHEEIMKSMRRRSIATRFIAGGINIALGIQKIFSEEYTIAAIQIALGLLLIIVLQYPQWFVPPFRYLFKLFEKYWPKKKEKKQKKEKPVESPNFIRTYLTENHDKFCPPVAFVDPNDTAVRV